MEQGIWGGSADNLDRHGKEQKTEQSELEKKAATRRNAALEHFYNLEAVESDNATIIFESINKYPEIEQKLLEEFASPRIQNLIVVLTKYVGHFREGDKNGSGYINNDMTDVEALGFIASADASLAKVGKKCDSTDPAEILYIYYGLPIDRAKNRVRSADIMFRYGIDSARKEFSQIEQIINSSSTGDFNAEINRREAMDIQRGNVLAFQIMQELGRPVGQNTAKELGKATQEEVAILDFINAAAKDDKAREDKAKGGQIKPSIVRRPSAKSDKLRKETSNKSGQNKKKKKVSPADKDHNTCTM